MKTPFEILGVATDANDVEIKRAYLQKVKNYPPDRDQAQFQLIHKAYVSIKDENARISYALFNLPVVDFDTLLDHAFDVTPNLHLTPEQFMRLLQLSVDDTALLNVIPNLEQS